MEENENNPRLSWEYVLYLLVYMKVNDIESIELDSIRDIYIMNLKIAKIGTRIWFHDL